MCYMGLSFDVELMRNFKSGLLIIIWWLFLCWNFSFAWNPFVRNLLWTQLEIWLNQRWSMGVFKNLEAWNALSIQQDVAYSSQYDLISELDRAKTEEERLVIIDNYIVMLNSTISDGSSLYSYEQQQVTYYNNAAKECEAPIKWKNSEFASAVKSYNYDKAEAIASEIAELRACVARNQVYAKAHSSYWSTANSLGNLKKKSEYLSKNRDKIAKYYEILKPDLLKELYEISKTVDSDF